VRVYLVCLCLLWSTVAVAQDTHVAIVAVRGKGGGAQVISGLQGALKKLGGITFEPTANFRAEAEQRNVGERVESDPEAMARVARALQVDAVVRGDLETSRRNRDQSLTLTVYDGGSGRLLGEAVVNVPKGKLSPKVFGLAARAIEPYVRQGDHRAAAPVRAPEPVVAVVEAVPDEAPARLDDEVEPAEAPGTRGPLFRLRAGLSTQARAFEYRAEKESVLFLEEGINYDSSLAPGFGIEAEVYPLATTLRGPAAGVGFTARFDKVFLETKQTVTNEDQSTISQKLDTNQTHARVGLRYRYGFSESSTSPELQADLGLGWSTFELENNDEYRGTSYQYWLIGLGGLVPLGTPLAIAEARFNFVPTADLGDTTEELAGKAEVLGFGFNAGLTSRLGGGLFASLVYDWQMYTLELSGAGRGGRVGRTAQDTYSGVRLLAGWAH
jgi:hypothetical protein